MFGILAFDTRNSGENKFTARLLVQRMSVRLNLNYVSYLIEKDGDQLDDHYCVQCDDQLDDRLVLVRRYQLPSLILLMHRL